MRPSVVRAPQEEEDGVSASRRQATEEVELELEAVQSA